MHSPAARPPPGGSRVVDECSGVRMRDEDKPPHRQPAVLHLCHLAGGDRGWCTWRQAECHIVDLAWRVAYDRGHDVRAAGAPGALGFEVDGSVCSVCVEVSSAAEIAGLDEDDRDHAVLVALDLPAFPRGVIPPEAPIPGDEEDLSFYAAEDSEQPQAVHRPERLPCDDCPKRPTRDRPRTGCPCSRFDTRKMTRAYVEWVSWWVEDSKAKDDKHAGHWEWKRGSLSKWMVERGCKKLSDVVGYPEGDKYALEMVAETEKFRKRDEREERAIREGREPGKVGRPPGRCSDLTTKEREIDEAAEEMVGMGSSRASAINAVALARGVHRETVRKVLSRVDRKRARQKPVP